MSDERKEKHVPAPEGKREAARQKEDPGGRLRQFGNFLLVLIVVLGVVALAAYRDGTGFDMLRRYLNYGRPSEAGGEVLYDYDASGRIASRCWGTIWRCSQTRPCGFWTRTAERRGPSR